jgi:hypothetical protein
MRFRWLILSKSLIFLVFVHAISIDEYRHLLSRTGFGARPADLTGCHGIAYDGAFQSILDHTHRQAVTPPPRWINEPYPERAEPNMTEEQRKALRIKNQTIQRQHGQKLKAPPISSRLRNNCLLEKMLMFARSASWKWPKCCRCPPLTLSNG